MCEVECSSERTVTKKIKDRKVFNVGKGMFHQKVKRTNNPDKERKRT